LSTLGPDCRIYIRPGSSSNSFHVIHKPNEKGVACDLVQQGIKLPEISATGGFPNFPRFRVDEEEKCDPSILTVNGEDVFWRRELVAYPNPCRDYTTLIIPDSQRGEIFLVDMNGQIRMHLKDIHQKEFRVDMSDLSIGNYSLEFVPDNNKDRVVYSVQISKVE